MAEVVDEQQRLARARLGHGIVSTAQAGSGGIVLNLESGLVKRLHDGFAAKCRQPDARLAATAADGRGRDQQRRAAGIRPQIVPSGKLRSQINARAPRVVGRRKFKFAADAQRIRT
jgi:hypothetical protein